MKVPCSTCEGTGVSRLRRSIMAPPGHVIVVRDLSAIEARVLAWLAEQEDVLEKFRRGIDVYCDDASVVFGREITKKDKKERFVGKTERLSMGYGIGWKTYGQRLRIGILGDKGTLLGPDIAASLGIDPETFMMRWAKYIRESQPLGLSEAEYACHCACAQRIHQTFRDNNASIVGFWETCQLALETMYRGGSDQIGRNGVIGVRPEGFLLPNGMMIRYTELEKKQGERGRAEFTILKSRKKGERAKVYGGLSCENISQALAGIIIKDAMVKMHVEGIRVVHSVHDEILSVCKESEAERVFIRMGEIMDKPPSWAPDLPIASEGGWNRRYIK